MTGTLLTHTDVPHYINPLAIESFMCLEGCAEFTLTSALAVCEDMCKEDPEAFEALATLSWHMGRAFAHYSPTMHTANYREPVVQKHRDGHGIKMVKLNSHLHGFPLTSSFKAQEAWERGYEMLQFKAMSEPYVKMIEYREGDCFLVNNHRVLHGRKKVLQTPRTVLNTGVHEDSVMQSYRELKVRHLKLGDSWVATIPTELLDRQRQVEKDFGVSTASDYTATAGFCPAASESSDFTRHAAKE